MYLKCSAAFVLLDLAPRKEIRSSSNATRFSRAAAVMAESAWSSNAAALAAAGERSKAKPESEEF